MSAAFFLDVDIDFMLAYQSDKRTDRSHAEEKWVGPAELVDCLVAAGLKEVASVHVVGEHDEILPVLEGWKEPLPLVHLDAHSDLYDSGAPTKDLWDSGYRPNEGNFLRFSLDLGFIDRIVLVPPKWFDPEEFLVKELSDRYRSHPKISISSLDRLRLPKGPAAVFIARSPSYTPPSCEADVMELADSLMKFKDGS